MRNFKEYEDKDVTARVEEDSNASNVQIPLREGILKTNFGLPLMVVVTKVFYKKLNFSQTLLNKQKRIRIGILNSK